VLRGRKDVLSGEGVSIRKKRKKEEEEKKRGEIPDTLRLQKGGPFSSPEEDKQSIIGADRIPEKQLSGNGGLHGCERPAKVGLCFLKRKYGIVPKLVKVDGFKEGVRRSLEKNFRRAPGEKGAFPAGPYKSK